LCRTTHQLYLLAQNPQNNEIFDYRNKKQKMSVLTMTAYLEIRCVTCVPYLIFQHSCWKHICEDLSGSWSKQRFFMDHVCVYDWRQDGPIPCSPSLLPNKKFGKWAVSRYTCPRLLVFQFRFQTIKYTQITPILRINCTAHATTTHSHIEYLLGPHDPIPCLNSQKHKHQINILMLSKVHT